MILSLNRAKYAMSARTALQEIISWIAIVIMILGVISLVVLFLSGASWMEILISAKTPFLLSILELIPFIQNTCGTGCAALFIIALAFCLGFPAFKKAVS